VHCFAEPWSHSPPGCVYDAPVAKRAFALMHAWLAEAFAGTVEKQGGRSAATNSSGTNSDG
jgi:hypothetical protein